MLLKAYLKKYWHWAGLALLSAVIAATALIAPGKVSQLELGREALVAENRINAQLLEQPNIALDALTRPGLAPQLGEVFEQSGYARRVLRYELYDARGRLIFTSGQANLQLGDELVDVKINPAQQGAVVGLYTGAGKDGPSHFAVLRLPMAPNQQHGTLIVYLDQSDQAAVFTGYFGLIAIVTLVLLGIGVATPVAFAWMRSQERREAQEQVRYLESHDALTGLANRRAFAERLGEAIVRMKRDNTHIAVICLDIDKFKEINDATEHGGGDQVLREIAARIRDTLRGRDIIARLGADEFSIALVDITNLGDVMAFMNRLVAALRPPFHVAGKEILITTSVGLALAPAHFISVAEETGLIVPIGECVLRRACFDAVGWPEHLTVAVNLSPAQFRDSDIAETVADVLHETGLPAQRLELEITENLLINDTEEVLSKLNRLRDLGVKIAMDDFGTGYSSLSYLARFPFSKIKIDRQFIRNMTRDPAMRAIVKTIIALGKSLDVTITAEGVETPEQAEMLRKFGCRQVEGFLYGHPEADNSQNKQKPRSDGKVTPIRARRSSAA